MNRIKNNLKNLKEQTIKGYLYEEEIAVPVINNDDYYVTSYGRVFSAKIRFTYTTLRNVDYCCIVWKELKPFYCHQYFSVSLSKKGSGKKNIYLHKLVYESFYGEYDTHWFKICFRDGDVGNCNKDNLALKFKYKSKKKLEEYQRQQRILQILQ